MVLQRSGGGGKVLILAQRHPVDGSWFAAPMADDWFFGAVLAICFAGLILIAEVWRARGMPPAEWTRKLVHLGGGVVCLAIPFLIHSHWVVLVLSISMAAIFIASKRFGLLSSIHGIERPSAGTEFYPVVIYLLFLLCRGVEWKFVICVLVLAVSDSAAALVGQRFGRLRFAVEDECKSVEGSAAFFLVTFAVVFFPLLVWDPLAGDSVATWHYGLAASLIGLLVMSLELISLRGMDNLWVPLGTLLVLTKTMQTDELDLILQNVSFIGILITVVVTSFASRTFNVGGAIVLCLGSYSCWAMGSFDWALPVMIGFGFYLAVSYLAKSPWKLKVRPVLYSLTPPFLILATANVLLNQDRPDLYQVLFVPFLVAVSVALGQGCSNLAGWKFRRQPYKIYAVTAATALLVSFVLNVPAVWRGTIVAWPTLMVICIVVEIVTLISCFLVRPLPPGNAPTRWLVLRVGLTALAFLAAWILAWMGMVPTGTPT